MREEFEAWVQRDWPAAPLHHVRDALPKDDPRYGEYCNEMIQRAWVGWQASRAALRVELPLIAEVERLRARLEISDKHPYDGIACRDETIKGLDEKCDRLKAENEGLREKLTDCADSLHAEMLQKYGGQLPDDMHPVTRRDYDRDMAEVAEYRAALEGGGR
ncbi:hypothetical protein A6723_019490 [Pseudomonas sp. AU11447]|nr:hypothetical protein A6723_019490 [Pseudomonas sp. AU11447]